MWEFLTSIVNLLRTVVGRIPGVKFKDVDDRIDKLLEESRPDPVTELVRETERLGLYSDERTRLYRDESLDPGCQLSADTFLASYDGLSQEDREAKMLQAVKDGDACIHFTTIEVAPGLEITVMSDAVRWNGVRAGVSYSLALKIAAAIGCVLPTARVVDLMWANADSRLLPQPRKNIPSLTTVVDHNSAIESLSPGPGLRTGWKHWVQTSRGVANYGWHCSEAPSWRGIKTYAPTSGNDRVIQPIGHVHGKYHWDYSQLCQLMLDHVSYNGQTYRLADFLESEHGYLLDHEKVKPVDSPPSKPKHEFIKARHYTEAKRVPDNVRLVVLHSTENPVGPNVARNVARWFAGPSAPRASAHWIVGPDEIVQGLEEHNVAWTSPGANRDGIQVEQVGQAAKTDWLKEGYPVLLRSARLVAEICKRWHIPIRKVTPKGLVDGESGITTHASVTRAYGKSSHVDPGMPGDKRWPWAEYLELVRGFANGSE